MFRVGDWEWIIQEVERWLASQDSPRDFDPCDLWDDLGITTEATDQPYVEAREQTVTVLEQVFTYRWARVPGTSLCYLSRG